MPSFKDALIQVCTRATMHFWGLTSRKKRAGVPCPLATNNQYSSLRQQAGRHRAVGLGEYPERVAAEALALRYPDRETGDIAYPKARIGRSVWEISDEESVVLPENCDELVAVGVGRGSCAGTGSSRRSS